MANVRQEILVVCLVESSVAVLHEWNDVLLTYVSPLLQRIASAGAAKASKNDLRIGFVSYSDSYVHPNPILARRFFSPVLQLTKEFKDDPASLGLGRTASGGRRGMAVLEGYVAVLEMFDAASGTRPLQDPLRSHPPNEAQKETLMYDQSYYLIHIASSSPNKATKPSWNTNPALDTITWASLPSELHKRKIRCNMILTRSIPELQELYKHISRTPDPAWISLMKPCHKLLFSGLPPKDIKVVPQKRAASDSVDPQQQPAPPRSTSREQTSTISTATPPAATNTTKSPSRPASVTSAPPAPPLPEHQTAPQPSVPTPAPPPPPIPSQPPPPPQLQTAPPRVPSQNIDPIKLTAYIRALENDCRVGAMALQQARVAGKPQAELDVMQADINQKLMNRTKLLTVYQQVLRRQQQQIQQTNGGAPPNQSGVPLNQQSMNQGQTQQPGALQEQTDIPMVPPNTGPSGQNQVIQPHTASGSFPNLAGANLGNKNPFQSIPISARPGMEAQMAKMLAERTRPPVLAAAPQTQSQPPIPPQNPMQNSPPNISQNPGLNLATSNPNIAEIMTPRASLGVHLRRWQGALAWPTGAVVGGTRKENQLSIALYAQDENIRYDSWPSKMILQPSQNIAFNMQLIQGWVKEFSPSMGLISSTPILGNPEATLQNARLFHQLKDLIQRRNMLGYCKFDVMGGPPGTGLLTFPMNAANQGDLLVAMIFHRTPLPPTLTGQASSGQIPSDAGSSTEVSSVSQATNAVPGPVSLQNMTSETKAYLQQRKAAAVAYNQQQLAQQQAQQQGLVGSAAVAGPPTALNVAQFLQNMPGMQQAAGGDNPIGLGGLNIPQAPALQQVQHRQPTGFNPGLNPGQMSGHQMLQYPIRRPDEGPSQ
ncbi:hypothetical protein K439DRAFT_1636478 [Ramaria rubella]|nr:hypothetical protein K439DRAFT_1636478 [Ramaria rubella]